MSEALQVSVVTGIPWRHKSGDVSYFGFQKQQQKAQSNFLLSL